MITGRTLVMFFLTLVAVRVMGKRSIAQLAPFDLVVMVIIGSVAALPLEEEQIHPVHGIVPILILSFLQFLLAIVNMRWRGFEKITQGMSTPIVIDGKVVKKNLEKERVSDADLHIVLRQQGVEKLSDISLAVLEPTGQVSVILKKDAQPVTSKDVDQAAISNTDAMVKMLRKRSQERYNDLAASFPRRSLALRRRTP